MKAIKKLAIVINAEKDSAHDLGEYFLGFAKRMGVKGKMEKAFPLKESFLKGMDACCVIGGDGTILAVVKQAIAYDVPVFGINQGKLGFLATFNVGEAKRDFEKILAGEYSIEKRFVLEAKMADGQTYYGLNDIVIKHMAPSRMTEMQVYANSEYVTSYSGDGLIISTPTGSTAYNLSAGGPIVHPGAMVLLMTPICPHTLTNRSVVFDSKNELKIDLADSERGAIMVALDGQIIGAEAGQFPMEAKIADFGMRLIQPKHYSHFKTLRTKLRWGD